GEPRRPGTVAVERRADAGHEAVVLVARAAERLRADADGVVRLVAGKLIDGGIAEVHRRVEGRAHVGRDVGAEAVHQAAVRAHLPGMRRRAGAVERGLLEFRKLEDADFVVAARGQEVANRVRAAVELEADGVAIAIAERRRVRIGDRVIGPKAVLDALAGGNGRQRALPGENQGRTSRGVAGEGVVVGVVMTVVENAAFGESAPPRRAGPALLGRDDDDAVGRIGAVERGRGRTFHDLDVFDLLGIDVAETAEVASAVAEVRRAVIGTHANAVDDVDRIVGEADAAHAANADALAGAGLTAALDHHARDAAVQHVREVPDGSRLGQLADVDVRDGVPDLDAPLLAGSGGHDLLELHDARDHDEIDGERLSLHDGNRLLLLLVTDADDADLGRADRHAGDLIFAVGPRGRGETRADDDDAGILQRGARALHGHGAGER